MSYKTPLLIAVTIAFLVGADYLAAWVEPDAVPPNRNVAAPLNTGTAPQDKNGPLGVNALSVFGRATINTEAPTVVFEDTTAGERGWWARANNDNFYFMFDRNNDGVGTGEEPWPLMLSGARDAANDYAVFSNQVRAREYCDRAGNNCFTAASVDDEEVSCQTVPYIRTSPVSFGGGGTVPCNWNDFSCMANYCQTTYGGWAGYHASALRVSGDSISSFSCHDWDTTSTCRTPTITNNTRPY